MEAAEPARVFRAVDMGGVCALVLLGEVGPKLPPCLLRGHCALVGTHKQETDLAWKPL